MSITEFINTIKKADLSKVSYNKIVSSIRNNSIRLPFTTALIKKGAVVERGRINKNEEIFNSEFEISYRLDYANITEFGRANRPHQSRFYGAMPSKNIPIPRVVLFSELVEQFNKIPKNDFETTMTVGRWYVKNDFEIADICFSDSYSDINELKNRYEFWIEKTKNTEIGQQDYINLLIFFSNEFSKTNINNHFDYKLSSIYTDIAIQANGLNGIGYPSVKSEYQANNLALTQEAVESFLELREVAMFRFVVKNGIPNVFQTHYSDSLGAFNSRFKWDKIEK